MEIETKVLSSYDFRNKGKSKRLIKQLDVLKKINESMNTIFNLIEKTNDIINNCDLYYEKSLYKDIQERRKTIYRTLNKSILIINVYRAN